MLNNNLPNEATDHEEYSEKPSFSIGDWRVIGNTNRYDVFANHYGIQFHFADDDDVIQPVKSNLKVLTVLSIELHFRPKPEYRISSWYSNGDYSADNRFESYWRAEFYIHDTVYELADFLDIMEK